MSDLEKLLQDISPNLVALDDLEENPGKAFRLLYDSWVGRGPFRRGKPLHSVKMIKSWLGQERAVRSLETKLTGQTRLPRQDALSLATLFLSHWRYENGCENGRHYSDEDPREVAERVINDLYPPGTETLLLPLRGRSQQNSKAPSDSRSQPSADVEASRDVITDLFAKSDALITISRDKTLITKNPAQSMSLFQSLMKQLCEIDDKDDRRRALIWVVDFGLRDERESSLDTFLNIVSLASQFRAIGIFSSSSGMKLWRDLSKRVIVIVGSLHHYEIDRIYQGANVELPDTMPNVASVVGDRMLLEAIPRRWLEIGQSAETFGLDQSSFWLHPTVTAHLSLEDWALADDEEVDPRKDLRYFYHAPLPPHSVAHCIELQQPGVRWSDGFRTACDAAFFRLGLKNKQIDKTAAPSESIALLRSDGFAVLTLYEFVRLTNNLIKANLELDSHLQHQN